MDRAIEERYNQDKMFKSLVDSFEGLFLDGKLGIVDMSDAVHYAYYRVKTKDVSKEVKGSYERTKKLQGSV